MALYFKEIEQKMINKNGQIKKFTRTRQHNGKKGVEIINNDGKKITRRFKVKKCNRRNTNRRNTNRRNTNRRNISRLLPGMIILSGLNKKIGKKVIKTRKTRKRKKDLAGKVSRKKKNKKKKNKKKSLYESFFGV